MLVNAPVFGKLIRALGIRTNNALTKLDLSRCIPTLGMGSYVQAELATYRTFLATVTEVGAAEIILDPRSVTNWDFVIVGTQTIAAGGAPFIVPVLHDYKILSFGLESTAGTSVLFKEWVDPAIAPNPKVALYRYDSSTAGIAFNDDGAVQQHPSAGFFPAGDRNRISLAVTAAVTVDVSLQVVSAPPGILLP